MAALTRSTAAATASSCFPLGGTLGIQPLRNGSVPMGQESRLLSGVATGTPPVMPTALDAQPVFQYGIPGGAADDRVQLHADRDRARCAARHRCRSDTITADTSCSSASTTGSISGYYTTPSTATP